MPEISEDPVNVEDLTSEEKTLVRESLGVSVAPSTITAITGEFVITGYCVVVDENGVSRKVPCGEVI